MDAALHVRCRDLKSGNLLVDHEGCVKVADFGLSRLYHGMHTMTGGLGTFQVGKVVWELGLLVYYEFACC